jgi:hypothetical protein
VRAAKEEDLMKRLLIPAVSAIALAVAVPGAALAHGHGKHHHKSKPHHAAKARVEHFGPKSTTAPTSTSPTSSDNVGTVTSFVAGATPGTGVLTITPTNGPAITGNVTTATEIECQAPATATTADNHGDGGGDNSSGDGSSGDGQTQPSGTTTGTTTTTPSTEADDQNEAGDQGDQGDHGDNQSAACSTADLTVGAVVHEADLRVTSTGAEFKSIKLVK